mgnify:CR=1 FL=1
MSYYFLVFVFTFIKSHNPVANRDRWNKHFSRAVTLREYGVLA